MSSTHVPQKIRKRYVDDSFYGIKKDAVTSFQRVNEFHRLTAHISLTIENDIDQLSFLDTLFHVMADLLLMYTRNQRTQTSQFRNSPNFLTNATKAKYANNLGDKTETPKVSCQINAMQIMEIP